MNLIVRTFTFMLTMAMIAITASFASAQAPVADTAGTAPPATARPTLPTASPDAVLPSYYGQQQVPDWIARKQFQDQQRTLRLEYYKWIGYDPLRPTINSNPSMTVAVPLHPPYANVYRYNPFYPRTVYGW